MLFFIFAIIVALFLQSSLAPYLGFYDVFTTAFFPLILLISYELINGRINFWTKATKQATYLIILALFIIFIKICLDENLYFKSELQLLIVPALIIKYFNKINTKKTKVLKVLILLFFVIECSTAIIERIMQIHIFIFDDGANIASNNTDWEFRSQALLGHPLTNAMVVTTILTFILTSRISVIHKFIYFILGYFSLFCFNARGAMIISTIFMGPYFLYVVYSKSKKYKTILIMIIMGLFIIISKLVTTTSYGGRIMYTEKLIDGSAQTRLDVFEFYQKITTKDLLWGNYKNLIIVPEKLGAASIENGFIAIIIYYGIIFTIPILFLLFSLQYKGLTYFPKLEKYLILSVFYIIGAMNPNLITPVQWTIFIFALYAFKNEAYLSYMENKFLHNA